ncbi:MAG: Antilisterial bacteriocin subtilosin biosynthesis protein AlbA [Planctomycetes bacterium ADurb.Bin401]|nr:MAG: Antilisterial bacteriocin subtilosin biosynthesis protein AlbA [Planctomycetes bacterium ADurb.Bin401]
MIKTKNEMINVSRLYCGIENPSDKYHFGSQGPVVVYNCTKKCSLNCLHCYSRNSLNGKELDTKEAKDLLKQLAEINCAAVLFSGGEPLEREDLFELLDYSNVLGLRTVLSTNGNLIDAVTAKKLFDSGVSYAGVSIDGTEKTHDEFRGRAGSFKAAVNGIKACKEAGLKSGIRFTITKRNYNQINEIFFLASDLSVARICFYHLIAVGQAAKNDLKCSEGQLTQAFNEILDCARQYTSKGVCEVFTVGNCEDGEFILNRLKEEKSPLYEKSFRLLEKFGGNKIGRKIFAVDAFGNVHPSQFRQDCLLGNVKEKSIKEIVSEIQCTQTDRFSG